MIFYTLDAEDKSTSEISGSVEGTGYGSQGQRSSGPLSLTRGESSLGPSLGPSRYFTENLGQTALLGCCYAAVVTRRHRIRQSRRYSDELCLYVYVRGVGAVLSNAGLF